MKIQNVMAATLNETENPFTLEQLNCFANTSKDALILLNFDDKEIVGNVIEAKVEDGCLVLFVNLQDMYCIDDFYIVPGYKIPEYKIFAYGLTLSPMDETLSPLVFIKPKTEPTPL